MNDGVLFQQCIKREIVKMSTLVTDDDPEHAVPGENIFPKELDNDSSLSCPDQHNLHSFRHIVYSQENIIIPKRTRKWPHKINPLNIKDLNNNNRVKGHYISPTDFPKLLTPRIDFTVQVGIFEQGTLIQTTLKDFGSYFLSTKMPPTCLVVTKRKDTSNLIIRDTLLKIWSEQYLNK